MSQTPSKYGFFQRFNIEDLYNAFSGLEERQQILTVIAAIIAVLLLLVMPVSCASSKLSSMEKSYDKGNEDRAGFKAKIMEYQSLQGELEAMKKKLVVVGAKGSMNTVIEGLGNEAGVGSNIEKLKPINLGSTDYFEEDGLEATVSNVNLDQLVGFLYRLENYNEAPLRVKKLTIKAKYNRRDQLTANITISTLKLKTESDE